MHVMSVEYLRPMMGASPSSDQLQQQLSQNTRGHCRPSTTEGGKGGAHRARALSAAARGPHLSTRNPRPKERAWPGGEYQEKGYPKGAWMGLPVAHPDPGSAGQEADH